MKKLNIFTLENQDGRFILLHNDAIAQTLERGNRWEPHFVELVSKLINKNDIVMDCGANFGYNTIVMANILQNTGKIDSLISFCHIDASHDYNSVKKTIEMILPNMVYGGVLCGDDILYANVNRPDLNGGVERAVQELLPNYTQIGNFWYWKKI